MQCYDCIVSCSCAQNGVSRDHLSVICLLLGPFTSYWVVLHSLDITNCPWSYWKLLYSVWLISLGGLTFYEIETGREDLERWRWRGGSTRSRERRKCDLEVVYEKEERKEGRKNGMKEGRKKEKERKNKENREWEREWERESENASICLLFKWTLCHYKILEFYLDKTWFLYCTF